MYKCRHCKKDFKQKLIIDAKVPYKNKIYYYYSCTKCNTLRIKKYRNTDKGRQIINSAVYRSIKKHPEKQKARELFNYAVRSKKILKPNICEQCLQEKTLEGHHIDYTKPLDVVWLCRPCHSKLK